MIQTNKWSVKESKWIVTHDCTLYKGNVCIGSANWDTSVLVLVLYLCTCICMCVCVCVFEILLSCL